MSGRPQLIRRKRNKPSKTWKRRPEDAPLTTLAVPRDLHAMLKYLAKKDGVSIWQATIQVFTIGLAECLGLKYDKYELMRKLDLHGIATYAELRKKQRESPESPSDSIDTPIIINHNEDDE